MDRKYIGLGEDGVEDRFESDSLDDARPTAAGYVQVWECDDDWEKVEEIFD